jgi:hypothetical protein
MSKRKLAGILCITAAGILFLASYYYYSLASMRYLNALCTTLEPCVYINNPFITLSLGFGTGGGIIFVLGLRLLTTASRRESIQKQS